MADLPEPLAEATRYPAGARNEADAVRPGMPEYRFARLPSSSMGPVHNSTSRDSACSRALEAERSAFRDGGFEDAIEKFEQRERVWREAPEPNIAIGTNQIDARHAGAVGMVRPAVRVK